MQKNLYLIIILFSLSSCYTYQVKKQADPEAGSQQDSKKGTAPGQAAPAAVNPPQTPVPVNIQEKLAPNKNYKINAEGRSYKIIVDRWENDSLVAHPVRHPEKILKFHKNQINGEKIAEKRFSQPIADIITVIAYAGIGVVIYSLVR
ncbi:hypothetical protein [Chryseobacterium gregarium]|uniref:hypothetical protein n=1 Tax=Chryseobacterium gregarium TaxID=456299 RepID=UPI00041809A3|nr:hypothetical protein [Chryseobacterium gregarium]